MKRTNVLILLVCGIFFVFGALSYAGEVIRFDIPTENLKKTEKESDHDGT